MNIQADKKKRAEPSFTQCAADLKHQLHNLEISLLSLEYL